MEAYYRHKKYLLLLFIATSSFIVIWPRVTDNGRIHANDREPNLKRIDDISNLRYLAFGSSITWGATLHNRSDAYPYLLSNEAANLALRSTGPNYPSICTQSMVGDEVYDVILLEYFYRASDGLQVLAERLRQRFPNAVIIFVQLWNPKMIHHKKNRSFENVHNLTEAIEATSSADWEFRLNKINRSMRFLEDAAKSVNGYILKGPPFPTERYDDIDVKSLVLQTISMFSPDWFHLSKEGHRVVAEAVKEFLQTIPVKVKRSNEVGTWGKGDLCHKWYETGQVDVPYSKGARLALFGPGKYALQFPARGGWMQITNPFEEARSLTLFFMTTGPAPSIYPKTKVKIINSPSKAVIDPVSNDYNFPVHVSDCSNVGLVKPGKNVISIKPLETTQKPFRVIAFALANEDVKFSENFIGAFAKMK